MATSNEPTILPNGLPAIKRFVTDHDSAGKAVFTQRVGEDLNFKDLQQLPFENASAPAKSVLAYATKEFPTTLKEEADIATYEGFLIKPPGVSIPGGTVLRLLDIPPSAISPMHCTKSLDYAIVLEGKVLAGLDSGEEKLMNRGDILIQRGTNHNWKNASETEWARVVFILMDSEENPLTK